MCRVVNVIISKKELSRQVALTSQSYISQLKNTYATRVALCVKNFRNAIFIRIFFATSPLLVHYLEQPIFSTNI